MKGVFFLYKMPGHFLSCLYIHMTSDYLWNYIFPVKQNIVFLNIQWEQLWLNFARNILDAGDFGTVIVHTVAEVKDAALQEMASVGKESILHKDAARSSHVPGDKAANLWYVASFFHLIFLLFLSFFSILFLVGKQSWSLQSIKK